MPRQIDKLITLDLALALFVIIAALRWRERGVRLSGLMVGLGVAFYFIQITGAGVDMNAGFDLIIALSIGMGVVYTQLSQWSRWPRWLKWPQWPYLKAVLPLVLLIVLFIRMQPERPDRLKAYQMVFAAQKLKAEIAARTEAMEQSIARVQATPGEVLCSPLVSFRAGKPFAVDEFNTLQRIYTGHLPKDVIGKRLKDGSLTRVATERNADWNRRYIP